MHEPVVPATSLQNLSKRFLAAPIDWPCSGHGGLLSIRSITMGELIVNHPGYSNYLLRDFFRTHRDAPSLSALAQMAEATGDGQLYGFVDVIGLRDRLVSTDAIDNLRTALRGTGYDIHIRPELALEDPLRALGTLAPLRGTLPLRTDNDALEQILLRLEALRDLRHVCDRIRVLACRFEAVIEASEFTEWLRGTFEAAIRELPAEIAGVMTYVQNHHSPQHRPQTWSAVSLDHLSLHPSDDQWFDRYLSIVFEGLGLFNNALEKMARESGNWQPAPKRITDLGAEGARE